MSREAGELDELRGLLEALCEERIAPREAERLEAILRLGPRFEEYYVTYMTMQADLVREFGGHDPGLACAPSEAAGPERPPLGGRDGGPGPRRSWLPWGIAAAASVIAGASLVLWETGRRDRPAVVSRPDRAAAVADSGGGRLLAKDRRPVAVVVQQVGALWEPTDGPTPAEGCTLPAGRLLLRSGVATLAYVNGILLTMEGPADLDLISADRVFCRSGRLRARVPKGAEGFVIASPSSAVVDLGTEFGLNVKPDGRSEVMVFEGAAEVALLSEAGAPEHSQLVEKSKAYDLDPRAGRIWESPARPEGFVSSPELVASDLKLSPTYAGTVLRSGPRGYWRFENLAGGLARNEVAGGRPLRVHGPIRPERSPSGNGYAAFSPGSHGQFLDSEGLWTLPSEPGHAVECWFQPEAYSRASLVGFYPPRGLNPPDQRDRYLHTFLAETMSWERLMLHKPASIRFLHRWPLDMRVNDSQFSEKIYVPRRWHHLVAQKAGNRLELYLDGQLEQATALGLDHPTLDCHLVVGRRTPESENPWDSRSFVGRLDELAFYDHTLAAEEVRGHFRLGSESPRPK